MSAREQEMHTIVVAPPENPAAGQAPMAPVADLPVMPGTLCSLTLRTVQSISTLLAGGAMVSADDFPTVPAFVFLVAASALQSLWAILLALLNLYALVAKFPLGNHWAASLSAFGDAMIAALTLCAASASSGIILVIRADMRECATTKNCGWFEAATGMMLISFVASLPFLALNWLELHVLVAS